jgi:hypothetical protein
MAGPAANPPEPPESAASLPVLFCKTLVDLRLNAGGADGEAVMHAGKPLAVLAYVGLAPRGRAGFSRASRLRRVPCHHSRRCCRRYLGPGGLPIPSVSPNPIGGTDGPWPADPFETARLR